MDISPSPILQGVKSITEIDKEKNINNNNKRKIESDSNNNNSQQESVDVPPSQIIMDTIVKDGNW